MSEQLSIFKEVLDAGTWLWKKMNEAGFSRKQRNLECEALGRRCWDAVVAGGDRPMALARARLRELKRDKRTRPTGGTKRKTCCACGSDDLAPGILTLNRPAVLTAFPHLRPRKRFPLCHQCRVKLTWVETT